MTVVKDFRRNDSFVLFDLLLHPVAALSCFEGKETVTVSWFGCGFLRAAQTTEWSDRKQVDPDRVKETVDVLSYQVHFGKTPDRRGGARMGLS